MDIVDTKETTTAFVNIGKGDVFFNEDFGYCLKIAPDAVAKWTAVQLSSGYLIPVADDRQVRLIRGRFILEPER